MKRVSILLFVFSVLALSAIPSLAQSFNLIGPDGSRLIRDVNTHLPAFEWEPVSGATSYALSLFKISTNPRAAIGTVFSINVLPANCTTTCLYTPSGPQYAVLDTGEYAWTVIADLPSDDIEASNAPLFFSINTAPIALLGNPGFETGTLDPWRGVNLISDELKSDKGSGNSWGFQFKGGPGENAKLTQKVNVSYQNIDQNDVLQFSAEYRAPRATAQLNFVTTVVYTPESGLPKSKFTLSAMMQPNFTVLSAPFIPSGPVSKIKVDVVHQSLSGKLWVDNIQITLP